MKRSELRSRQCWRGGTGLAAQSGRLGDSAMVSSLLLVATIAMRNGQLPTAEELHSQIDENGPKQTLLALYNDHAQWTPFLDRIAYASLPWLEVANRLLTASDAGAANELEFALGDALNKNAERVLRTIDDIDFACGLFSLAGNCDDLTHAFTQREAAVRAIEVPSLQKKRVECLAVIVELRKDTLEYNKCR